MKSNTNPSQYCLHTSWCSISHFRQAALDSSIAMSDPALQAFCPNSVKIVVLSSQCLQTLRWSAMWQTIGRKSTAFGINTHLISPTLREESNPSTQLLLIKLRDHSKFNAFDKEFQIGFGSFNFGLYFNAFQFQETHYENFISIANKP